MDKQQTISEFLNDIKKDIANNEWNDISNLLNQSSNTLQQIETIKGNYQAKANEEIVGLLSDIEESLKTFNSSVQKYQSIALQSNSYLDSSNINKAIKNKLDKILEQANVVMQKRKQVQTLAKLYQQSRQNLSSQEETEAITNLVDITNSDFFDTVANHCKSWAEVIETRNAGVRKLTAAFAEVGKSRGLAYSLFAQLASTSASRADNPVRSVYTSIQQQKQGIQKIYEMLATANMDNYKVVEGLMKQVSTLSEVYSQMGTYSTSGMTEEYASALHTLAEQLAQTAHDSTVKLANTLKINDLERIIESFAQINRRNAKFINPILNHLQSDRSDAAVTAFDKLTKIHSIRLKRISQILKTKYKILKDSKQVTYTMSNDWSKKVSPQSYTDTQNSLLNQFLNAKYNNHSIFNNSKYNDFEDALYQANRVMLYNDQHLEQTAQNLNKIAQQGSKRKLRSQFRRSEQLRVEVIKRNDASLLDVTKAIPSKKELFKGTQQDAAIANQLTKQLLIAVRNTVREINAQKAIDPNSKRVQELEQYKKALQQEIKELDEAKSESRGSEFFQNIFKDMSGAWRMLGSGLGIFGMGGLLSIGAFANMIRDRMMSNDSMLWRNSLTNYSMGVNGNYGTANRMYQMGTQYYDMTHGEIDFNAPTELYTALVNEVGGAYNSNPQNNARDLQYFTKTLLAPAQLYNIDNGTMAQIVNELYKNNRTDAQNAQQSIYSVMQNAQRLGVPITQYMRTIAELNHAFRTMGYNGKLALNMVSYMVEHNMRLEDASDLATNIITVQKSFNRNISNAFFGIMSGQAGDMWTAIGQTLLTYNRFGDPIEGQFHTRGQRMLAKYQMYAKMTGGNTPISKMLVLQAMQHDGFSTKNASILFSKMEKGDIHGAETLLSNMPDNKLIENQNETASLKNFTQQLRNSAAQVSFTQKFLADRAVAANKIAGFLQTRDKSAMDALAAMFNSAISTYSKKMERLINIIGNTLSKLVDAIRNNSTATSLMIWGAQHPLIAFGASALAYTGTKRLIKYNIKQLYNHFMHRNITSSIENEAKESEGLISKTLGKVKNAGKFLLKSKKGKIGLAIATALAAYALYEKHAEGAKKDTAFVADTNPENDKQNITALIAFVQSGKGQIRLTDSNGNPLFKKKNNNFINNLEQSNYNELFNYAGALSIVGGAIGIKKLSDHKLNFLNNKVKILKTKLTKQKSMLKDLTEKIRKFSFKRTTSSVSEESSINNILKNAGGNVLKFAKNNKFNIGLNIIFSAIQEYNDNSNQNTTQFAGNVAIDTGIGIGLYKLGSLASKFVPGRYGKIAGTVGMVGGMLASQFTPQVSDFFKELLGLENKRDKINAKFMATLTEDTDMYNQNLRAIIMSRTLQGAKIRMFLQQNGVDFSHMNDTQKQIFFNMIQTLASEHITLAKLLAMIILMHRDYGSMIQQESESGNFDNGNKPRTKEEKLADAFPENDPATYYNSLQKAAQAHYDSVTAQLQQIGAEPNIKSDPNGYNNWKQLKKEQEDMTEIINYAKVKQGDYSPIDSVVNDTDSGSDALTDDEKNELAGELMSKWDNVLDAPDDTYGSWRQILINEYASNLKDDPMPQPQQNSQPVPAQITGGGSSAIDIVRSQNPEIAQMLINAANAEGIDPNALAAVALNEHSGHISADTHAYDTQGGYANGGYGFMQINPNYNPEVFNYSTQQNILEGAKIFRGKLQAMHGDYRLAIAAYNAGEGNVQNAIRGLSGAAMYQAADNVTTNHYLDRALGYMNGQVASGMGAQYSQSQINDLLKQIDNLGGGIIQRPQTLAQQQQSAYHNYQNILSSMGVKGQQITGVLVDNSWVDSSGKTKYKSIAEQLKEYKKIDAQEQLERENTERLNNLYRTRNDMNAVQKHENELSNNMLKQAIEYNKRREQQADEQGENTAHLQIIGVMKEGKTQQEFQQALNRALQGISNLNISFNRVETEGIM